MSTYLEIKCPNCGAPLDSPADVILCSYCGVWLMRPPQTEPHSDSATSGLVPGVRFSWHVVIDQQGFGIPAMRFLYPTGWQVEGGIYWIADRPAAPAAAAFRVRNPAGPEQFETFPTHLFYWSSDPMSRWAIPPGSRYFGAEVIQPVDSVQFIQAILIPRYRNIAGLQVHAVQRNPLTSENAYTQIGIPQTETALVDVLYPLENDTLEERLHASLTYHRMQLPGLWGVNEMINWSADYLYAIRARQGQLDGLADLFATIWKSVQINPQWMAMLNQNIQQNTAANIRHIQNIGALSRHISQVSNEIGDMISQSYWERQAVYDRVSEQWSQAMRGVDAYQDIGGNQVELPTGYQQAWGNPLGEYILSNDPFFDPNQLSNQNWTQLHRQG